MCNASDLNVVSRVVLRSFLVYGARGGPDYSRICTIGGKLVGVGNMQKLHHSVLKQSFLKGKYST